MALLVGMFSHGIAGKHYPSENDEPTWPKGWLPIPVHTIDIRYDYVLQLTVFGLAKVTLELRLFPYLHCLRGARGWKVAQTAVRACNNYSLTRLLTTSFSVSCTDGS
ncbi:unnamed protein product [Gongylonema pulchrum]|uniref:Secreted protein n=1 Tax=Gongylonema pulchrum TaxID=637853 RepID=A0A183E996_9BILA|nr:unnamed protein product [Gongylonema pulchrum]